MTAKPSSSMLVKDAMIAKPISIVASASPRELARALIDHGISGVPVVDDDGEVIGVVSKTDLLQWCVRGGLGFGASDLLSSLADGGTGARLEAIDLGIVADFMTETPLTAEPDEPLSVVARRMAEYQVHRLIVIDEVGRLQGIITSMDLLRVFPAAA
ncbi:MAG: CBS domain-containing protein [Phycisphaerales bacterium]|nr:CBS domain-containing protein [Phycisphaerales bacterium]MCI0675835.1 CBS domain-containing protein [Phycisphaerales bacterium]